MGYSGAILIPGCLFLPVVLAASKMQQISSPSRILIGGGCFLRLHLTETILICIHLHLQITFALLEDKVTKNLNLFSLSPTDTRMGYPYNALETSWSVTRTAVTSGYIWESSVFG
jgi:hypothetical protein